MERFSQSLRKHEIKIVNFQKKKLIRLTNEQEELHEKGRICCSCKNVLCLSTLTIKTMVKLGTIVAILVKAEVLQGAYVIQNILFLKKLPMDYDYHFMMRSTISLFMSVITRFMISLLSSLSIISLNKSIKLNVNTDMIIKARKTCGIRYERFWVFSWIHKQFSRIKMYML